MQIIPLSLFQLVHHGELDPILVFEAGKKRLTLSQMHVEIIMKYVRESKK